MNITGIITEYNPFHNGHQYHIEESRRLTNAEFIIAVMSPDYVQRGVPAVLDKHTRTKMALQQGVDLVLELPVEYACGSAEYFADAALSIFHHLGVVSHCCFGSEFGSIEPFIIIASVLAQEPKGYQIQLKEFLRIGDSFPTARRKALLSYLDSLNLQDTIDWELFLSSPNNILGIEYCKALQKLNSTMIPVTIARTENNYHEEQLSPRFSSATAIRSILGETADFKRLQNQMPAAALDMIKEHWHTQGPIAEDDFSLLLKYRLMCETPASLTGYLDVSESLAHRICNTLNQFQSFSQYAALLKSKDVTRTRINRSLLHILLNIRQTKPIEYVRILGFRQSSAPLLSQLKKASGIPLVTKLNTNIYDPFAANLYESVRAYKYNQPFIHEYSKPVVIVP